MENEGLCWKFFWNKHCWSEKNGKDLGKGCTVVTILCDFGTRYHQSYSTGVFAVKGLPTGIG